MATLYVRNFPDGLYERVKSVAARRRRSLAAEVTVLVENAVAAEEAAPGRVQALEDIAERRRGNPQPAGAVDTLDLLREDRAR